MIAVLLCAAALIVAVPVATAGQPPELFFYAPPYELADGGVMSSPVTVAPPQIAEDFPEIPEMSGVVLMVYWSRLCPQEHQCDFSIIKHALDFWGKRGKKVILNVVTVGPPMVVRKDGQRAVETPTPAWLLGSVATYQMEVPPIVPVVRPYVQAPRVMTTLPSYWDPRFLAATQQLINQLAQFDGDPALSKVRIGTGIMGEDNPSFDGLWNAMPGWSNLAWIKYCRDVTDAYRRAFKRSRLEFDVDRLGWIAAKGTPQDHAAADALVAYLNEHNIFLAMNGFDTDNIAQWRAKAQTGPAYSMAYIAERKRAGLDAGLEGAPLFSPKLQDVGTLATTFRELGADRLVLFADVPGALDLERHGQTAKNELTRQAIAPQQLILIAGHAKQLLGSLGFLEK